MQEKQIMSAEAQFFDVGKAVAVVGHLVAQTGESMYTILKMVYLSDKLHLERYGRLMMGERYTAMRQGPVPSNCYSIYQHLRGEAVSPSLELADAHFSHNPDHTLKALLPPDLDELSDSEEECLNSIISIWREIGWRGIRELSHDAPWQEAWDGKRLWSKSAPMPALVIAKHLEDSTSLAKHLTDPHPGCEESPEAEAQVA